MNNRKSTHTENWFGLKQTKPPTKTAFDECIMNQVYDKTRLYAKNGDFICVCVVVFFFFYILRQHIRVSQHIFFQCAKHRQNTRFVQPSNISILKRHYLLITFINMRSTMFSEHTASQMPQFQWIFTVFLLQVDFRCFFFVFCRLMLLPNCMHALKNTTDADAMLHIFFFRVS